MNHLGPLRQWNWIKRFGREARRLRCAVLMLAAGGLLLLLPAAEVTPWFLPEPPLMTQAGALLTLCGIVCMGVWCVYGPDDARRWPARWARVPVLLSVPCLFAAVFGLVLAFDVTPFGRTYRSFGWRIEICSGEVFLTKNTNKSPTFTAPTSQPCQALAFTFRTRLWSWYDANVFGWATEQGDLSKPQWVFLVHTRQLRLRLMRLVGIAAATGVLYPLGFACATAWAAFRERRRRRREGYCLRCGYDLRASLERCPECGTPIPADLVRKPLS